MKCNLEDIFYNKERKNEIYKNISHIDRTFGGLQSSLTYADHTESSKEQK